MDSARLPASLFSSSYEEARQRFCDAARERKAELFAYPLSPSNLDHTIDVSVLGVESLPTLLISSGVHGIEGFPGSAIQLGVLQEWSVETGVRLVLVHAVNPYGFAEARRFNEDNVDLNRNFLLADESYHGVPAGYAKLDKLLNPVSPPSRWEPFAVKAIYQILRVGLPALKEAIARGQYECPQGLFFGGHEPCASTRLIRDHCEKWVGASSRIMHIDCHSGLGAFGQYKLLINDATDRSWYDRAFGRSHVELLQEGDTAYPISGLFGAWMQDHFADRDYRFVGAEFGTYGVIRVLSAIRAENRAHHHGESNGSAYAHAKRELLECFCPRSEKWRERVARAGLSIARQAVDAIRTVRPTRA